MADRLFGANERGEYETVATMWADTVPSGTAETAATTIGAVLKVGGS
jgi:hypothetical protein